MTGVAHEAPTSESWPPLVRDHRLTDSRDRWMMLESKIKALEIDKGRFKSASPRADMRFME